MTHTIEAREVPLLVIGGGIGGMATALALARSGRRVHLIEKSPEFAEIGAGLQLAPNALRVLDALGVLDAVKSLAVLPRKLTLVDIYTAQALKVVEFGDKFVERFGYPYVVMHRHDLLTVLYTACRSTGLVTFETSKEVCSLIDHGDSAEVLTRDGGAYRCSGVIAADGLWSIARKTLFVDDAVDCTHYVAYRGTIPSAEISPFADSTDLVIWLGQQIHMVQYPVRRGALFNQVAVFKSDRYTPDSDDWGTVAELDQHFANTCEYVQVAIRKIGRHRRWPLCDRNPIVSWARNRIALLGDAAHPMLQLLAQGAAQALEDAACIARMLQVHDGDIALAFTAYQNQRFLRTATIQNLSRFSENFWHVGGAARQVRDRYLSQHPADRYDEFDWLYSSSSRLDGPLPR